MGFFTNVVAEMKKVVSATRQRVLLTEGYTKVFETPDCFETPPEDYEARCQEYADWANNSSGEEESALINIDVDIIEQSAIWIPTSQENITALLKDFNIQ